MVNKIAVLEFELPEKCIGCRLSVLTPEETWICAATEDEERVDFIGNNAISRPGWCPLREKEA